MWKAAESGSQKLLILFLFFNQKYIFFCGNLDAARNMKVISRYIAIIKHIV